MSSLSFPPLSIGPFPFTPSASLTSSAFPTGTVVSSSAFPSAFPSASPASASSTPLVANDGNFRTNTSTELLWREQTVNAAGYLAAIAWGLYLGIFYKAVVNIFKNKNRTNLRWLPFISGLFVTATISMCGFVNFNEQAWIDQRSYPRGPMYFLAEEQHIPVYVMAVAASLITQMLCQSFLVYRCHALWNKLWITVLLAVWAVTDCALAIGYAVILAKSRIHFSLFEIGDTLSLSDSSVEVAMAFNIVVTALLLWRVAYLAPKVPTSFPAHIRSKFVRVDAILVESILLLGLISMVYVCLFGSSSTGSNLFYPLIVQLEAIFPTLIVIRIVQGWGWDAGVIHRNPMDYHVPPNMGSDTSSVIIKEKHDSYAKADTA